MCIVSRREEKDSESIASFTEIQQLESSTQFSIQVLQKRPTSWYIGQTAFRAIVGSLDEAVELYRKGLQVIKDSKYIAMDDEVMEKIRIELADLYHIAGSSVTHLLNLATSYSRSKNFVEAERLQREGLRIMETAMGSEDPSITVPMLSLAVTLYHLKRDVEAEQFALEAVRIRERAFGNKSLIYAEALDCLISIQARIGNDDADVLALLKRVLSIQEKELGYESEEVVTPLKKIVFYLEKWERRRNCFYKGDCLCSEPSTKRRFTIRDVGSYLL
ncbi:hypothetical protein IFM89_028514 [Coptis chinensis]|uniref:MalT-like TPR region domain-containing protein n=1 Tax=Coptis chinensis TaxID=261450 RepID=A0A835LPD8_9MAGN|nr:hypothetical protein IFM89_028514 [Coptis chinensis]